MLRPSQAGYHICDLWSHVGSAEKGRNAASQISLWYGTDKPVCLMALPEENKSGYALNAKTRGIGLMDSSIYFVKD